MTFELFFQVEKSEGAFQKKQKGDSMCKSQIDMLCLRKQNICTKEQYETEWSSGVKS